MPSQRTTVALFDRIAHFYVSSPLLEVPIRALHRAVIEVAEEQAGSPARVLDVGCGPGRLLRAVAIAFPTAELVGVDPAPGMLREARAAVASLGAEASEAAPGGASAGRAAPRFIEALAQALPFDDHSFNLVLGSLTLHHWDDQEGGLQELQRVLDPGGLLVLAAVQAVGWLSGPLKLIGWRDRIRSAPETDAQLVAAGLQPVYRRRLRWSANCLQVVACRSIV